MAETPVAPPVAAYPVTTLAALCVGARYCNSLALIRVARDHSMAVSASAPMDATERFRDRTSPATTPLKTRELWREAPGPTPARAVTLVLVGPAARVVGRSPMLAAPVDAGQDP